MATWNRQTGWVGGATGTFTSLPQASPQIVQQLAMLREWLIGCTSLPSEPFQLCRGVRVIRHETIKEDLLERIDRKPYGMVAEALVDVLEQLRRVVEASAKPRLPRIRT